MYTIQICIRERFVMHAIKKIISHYSTKIEQKYILIRNNNLNLAQKTYNHPLFFLYYKLYSLLSLIIINAMRIEIVSLSVKKYQC